MFYSKSTNGFYLPSSRAKYEANGNWPSDAVEISDELYAEVVSNRPANKIVVTDENGLPSLADPAAPTDKQLAEAVRAERDALMATFQWRLDRHAREVRLGLTPTDDVAVLDAYMQALADITLQPTFPATVTWPAIPA